VSRNEIQKELTASLLLLTERENDLLSEIKDLVNIHPHHEMG